MSFRKLIPPFTLDLQGDALTKQCTTLLIISLTKHSFNLTRYLVKCDSAGVLKFNISLSVTSIGLFPLASSHRKNPSSLLNVLCKSLQSLIFSSPLLPSPSHLLSNQR